jgi:RimJ/RimL family protein N-acetyltransferase
MKFDNMPPLETPRLILRPPEGRDFEPFAKAQADANFKKYTGGILNRSRAREDFSLWQEFWELKEYGFFSIIHKETGLWIGRAGPTLRANIDFPEFGWAIIPDFQGFGYAYEAATKSIDWSQQKYKWNEAFFCIKNVNIASQQMAQKLGAKRAFQEKLPEFLKNQGVEVWHKFLQT